ncbi:MAG: SRPBCC domain-containing protein [Spirochaetales bacterium]|nr:MAG: SRPBCC domain-containing protein [Spirochaetales bacterium]
MQTDGGMMFVAGLSAMAEPALNDIGTIPGEETLPTTWEAEDRALFLNADPAEHFHALQISDFASAILEDREPAITALDGRTMGHIPVASDRRAVVTDGPSPEPRVTTGIGAPGTGPSIPHAALVCYRNGCARYENPCGAQGVTMPETDNDQANASGFPVSRYPEETTSLVLYKETIVKASLDEAWRAWTTDEGAREFFSPSTRIDLRIGGPYEIYFDLEAEPGFRGGEGNRILSFLPKSMLSFEWNAPPSFRQFRDIRTYVVVNFEPAGSGKVRVRVHHLGWGADAGWRSVYDYFDRAWDIVLGNFRKRFESGPLDWKD